MFCCNFKTPVRPSHQRTEVDVIVSTASLLRCVRQLNFLFNESSRDVVNVVTVQHILQEGHEYQRVSCFVRWRVYIKCLHEK